MRAQIVSDMFSLGQSTGIEPKLLFDTMKYIKNERAYLPWNVMISRANYYFDMLESSKANSKLQKYFRDLVSDYYTFIGWKDKEPTDDWLDRFLL